jgi:hypothetical protein
MRSSRSLLDLGLLAFDDLFFDQNLSPLLGVFCSILVEFVPSLAIVFDVQVSFG